MSRRLLILSVAVVLLAAVGGWAVLHGRRSGGAAEDLTYRQPGLAFVDRDHNLRAGGTVSGLKCLRFYSAAGTGVCLQSIPGALQQSNRALILDAGLHPLRTFPLAGTPSRARVSPSGHLVSWTVFVGGESYGSAFFSTRAAVLDTRTWQLTQSLEDFTIILDGRSYRNTDTNFWGVTFAADDDTFYATLGTGGRTYLVQGSLSRRTVTTLVQNVECPSLSPDGTRIAFKKRTLPGAALWHEYVLDLRTRRETPLAEHRSVDDQAAWLDGRTLAYALPAGDTPGGSDLWTVPADGTGTPRLLVAGASSPAPLSAAPGPASG